MQYANPVSNLQVGSQPVVLRPVVMEMKTTWKEERKDARCPQRMGLSLVNAENTGNLQPACFFFFFFLFSLSHGHSKEQILD